MLVLLVTVSSIEPRPRFLVADNPPLPIEPELALAVLLDEGNSSGVLTELDEVESVLSSLDGRLPLGCPVWLNWLLVA